MSSDLSGVKQPQRQEMAQKRVWDLPTRLIHWALAGAVCTGWYLGEYRDFSTIYLHFYFGYAVLALLSIRLLLWSRASSSSHVRTLFPSLKKLWQYAKTFFKRDPSGVDGHTPFGALAIWVLIALMMAQGITGLFAEDDTIFSSGPLAYLLDSTTVVTMTAYHYWLSRLMFLAVAIHISAVLFYWVWKKENLISPMITGVKWIRNQKQ